MKAARPSFREFVYQGAELDVFKYAVNWKERLRVELGQFVAGDVLEVGAGIGTTSLVLQQIDHRSWVCMEPDMKLAQRLIENFASAPGEPRPEVIAGTMEDLASNRSFDAILYVDVLEHIEDDRRELAAAASHLRPGGRLVVVAPAHQWLYTPFDRAIGHYRRYSKDRLLRLSPQKLRVERLRYLDSVGMLASLSNRLLLRSAEPSVRQIQIWDNFLVPLSQWLDPLLRYQVGKSILAIWSA